MTQTVAFPQAAPLTPVDAADAIQDAFDSFNSGNLGAGRPAYVTKGGSWTQDVSATSAREWFFDGVNDILKSEYNPTTHALIETNLAANQVTLAKLAQLASGRLMGRISVGSGDVESLTFAQVMANLPDMIGDSGPGGVAGRVPAPPAGSDALDHFLAADGTWKATPGGVLPGQFATFAMDVPPAGYLECYGQTVSRATYATLYAAVGDTWGAGNGSTTFQLPDARGRVIAGWDLMGGVSADRLTGFSGGVNGDTFAAAGGSDQHDLQLTEIPGHTHGITVGTGEDSLLGLARGRGAASTTQNTLSAGGGLAHNNVQPTMIGLVCIKY